MQIRMLKLGRHQARRATSARLAVMLVLRPAQQIACIRQRQRHRPTSLGTAKHQSMSHPATIGILGKLTLHRVLSYNVIKIHLSSLSDIYVETETETAIIR